MVKAAIANYRRSRLKPIGWKDIAELVGITAIIVGLILVYVELRQTSTIARVEMSNEANQIFAELDEQERDPLFANLLVKAETNPENLTQAERGQLNSYFRRVLHAYSRENYYYQQGLFSEWTSPVRRTAPRYFGSGYGRAWWDVRKTFFISSTRAEVAEEIERSLQNSDAVEFYQRFDGEIVRRLNQD